jgi:hypothetical protein
VVLALAMNFDFPVEKFELRNPKGTLIECAIYIADCLVQNYVSKKYFIESGACRKFQLVIHNPLENIKIHSFTSVAD